MFALVSIATSPISAHISIHKINGVPLRSHLTLVRSALFLSLSPLSLSLFLNGGGAGGHIDNCKCRRATRCARRRNRVRAFVSLPCIDHQQQTQEGHRVSVVPSTSDMPKSLFMDCRSTHILCAIVSGSANVSALYESTRKMMTESVWNFASPQIGYW